MSPKTVIRHYGGNRSLAAKELRIARRTLYNWIAYGSVPIKMRAYVAERMAAYRGGR